MPGLTCSVCQLSSHSASSAWAHLQCVPAQLTPRQQCLSSPAVCANSAHTRQQCLGSPAVCASSAHTPAAVPGLTFSVRQLSSAHTPPAVPGLTCSVCQLSSHSGGDAWAHLQCVPAQLTLRQQCLGSPAVCASSAHTPQQCSVCQLSSHSASSAWAHLQCVPAQLTLGQQCLGSPAVCASSAHTQAAVPGLTCSVCQLSSHSGGSAWAHLQCVPTQLTLQQQCLDSPSVCASSAQLTLRQQCLDSPAVCANSAHTQAAMPGLTCSVCQLSSHSASSAWAHLQCVPAQLTPGSSAWAHLQCVPAQLTLRRQCLGSPAVCANSAHTRPAVPGLTCSVCQLSSHSGGDAWAHLQCVPTQLTLGQQCLGSPAVCASSAHTPPAVPELTCSVCQLSSHPAAVPGLTCSVCQLSSHSSSSAWTHLQCAPAQLSSHSASSAWTHLQCVPTQLTLRRRCLGSPAVCASSAHTPPAVPGLTCSVCQLSSHPAAVQCMPAQLTLGQQCLGSPAVCASSAHTRPAVPGLTCSVCQLSSHSGGSAWAHLQCVPTQLTLRRQCLGSPAVCANSTHTRPAVPGLTCSVCQLSSHSASSAWAHLQCVPAQLTLRRQCLGSPAVYASSAHTQAAVPGLTCSVCQLSSHSASSAIRGIYVPGEPDLLSQPLRPPSVDSIKRGAHKSGAGADEGTRGGAGQGMGRRHVPMCL
ncbi:hypothetical protein NDU88_000404 [Pleurodeles waltl]|uniref:Uncharacterized protein n=1 Tax=Pleurodeles waltl TaxID=8319 RepID=A0AAV7V505_PLEWA|nr:hypothetical protein NDU88_000404 [Pleurodeles waltl]